MSDTMTGRDVYLRFNGGPVRHFRAWDVDRFIESQVAQGRNTKNPDDRYEVSVAAAADYLKQRRK